jgi:hypothetical protein
MPSSLHSIVHAPWLTPSHAVRFALAVAGSALCTVAALVGAHGREAGIVRSVENGGDWYARSPGWFTARGLYPTEHAPDGSAFAWAGGRLRLQIPVLDRSVPYTLGLRVRSGRGAGEPAASLRVLSDGRDTSAVTVGPEWQEFAVPLPASRRTGAVILVEAQQTFTPGSQDPRPLGFMIDRLTLSRTDGGATPIARVVWVHVAVFAAATAAAAVLCGSAAWVAFACGVSAGLGAVALVLCDSAYLGGYSETLPPLALSIVVLAALASACARLSSPHTRAGWRTAALFVVVVTILKLAVFLHPAAPVSDGMFHVHRAEAVRAGEYVFTSITPRPFFEFPYPIGLYVAAQPLWAQVADRVVLLRGITLFADALVAMALFAVISARWGSVSTGVLAAMFAVAVPVVTQSVSTANLTNVFAQSCFSLGVLWIGWRLVSPIWPISLGGTVLLTSAGFLSHFSTAVIGVPAGVLIAGLTACSRDPREARAWRWIALSIVLALGLSYLVYYSHFHDVYARTLSRMGSEGAETSFVATVAEHSESKVLTMGRFVVVNYGWGALALAVAGAIAACRRDWRQAWTLQLAAIGVTVLAFLLLGAFTPIEMRANLAAHPVVAAFAALGCASWWESRRLMLRLAAIAGLAATIWVGLESLRAVLGVGG